MCIISGPVLSVNSTKLLGLPSRNGKRQLTVYRNSVATPNSNVMCLPVPNPNSVRFERVPKDIFDQCKNSFDHIIKNSFSLSTTRSTKRSINRGTLPVLSHGSYDVVLVPSMDDIYRIPSHFTALSPDVIEFLNASYPTNFGLVLCKLKAGNADYEPFAYSHDIQDNKQIFFPTKHYHVHNETNYSRYRGMEDNDELPGWASAFSGGSLLGGSIMGLPGREMPKLVNTRFADDWDHEIYSAGTPQWCHESTKKVMRRENEINWNQMPLDFQLGNNLSLRCKEIVGEERNIDIEMPVIIA
jgi:hypothetical protein